jgi:nicotinamidase-related amidase
MGAKRPATAALIVIDVQKAIDDPVWAIDGERSDPEAEVEGRCALRRWPGLVELSPRSVPS